MRIGNRTFGRGYYADIIVDGRVLVELKSVEALVSAHKKQVVTYLKLSGIAVGLLINFGGALLKGNIERLVAGAAPDLKLFRPRGPRRPLAGPPPDIDLQA